MTAPPPFTPPEPPYYAVIFTSRRTGGDRGYGTASDRMLELVAQQPGFLGVDTARDADGLGITVSYWRDEESIRAWRRVAEHERVQRAGRATWYEDYSIHVARVERMAIFARDTGG
jgi:heme-degrading monooxygenase HmoA